jgi:hypothetical protein
MSMLRYSVRAAMANAIAVAQLTRSASEPSGTSVHSFASSVVGVRSACASSPSAAMSTALESGCANGAARSTQYKSGAKPAAKGPSEPARAARDVLARSAMTAPQS